MLSTKDVPASSGSGIKKTLVPGNQQVTIYDVEFSSGYNPGSMHILARVEGPDMGPEFEGFLKDKDNPGGGRFKGQVGRIKLSQYPFEDKTFNDGTSITRDQTMLKMFDRLAMACGVQNEIKNITANTWEEWLGKAKPYFINKQISTCIGAREYTGKSGYKELDLFFPKLKNGKYPFISATGDQSNLLPYDANEHIIREKAAKPVDAFEPSSSADDDFNF